MSFQDDFIQGQNEELIEYMKSSRLFSHIPDSLLATLVPISDLRVYDPEQEILVEGQENDRVFFLMRGTVQIFAGGEFILELKRQGDLFGEMSVISSKPASATVIAKTRVQVFSVLGRNIGRYTDIDVERINHILYRLFAAVLTDKLALTTYKAKQYEVVNIYLNKTQAALAEKHTQLLKEKKAAEAAANTKAAFIATMSHEIRTPLNGILGMTELLLSTHQTEEQRDFTESILISGRNLLSIINDILDFSKMEEEDIQVEVKPIRLQELVEECVALSAPDAALKGLELFERMDLQTPEEIKGDPKRIAQVLNNLLSNAVKFTDQGQVQLLVKPLEGREGKELLFEVKDTGIGIAPEKQAELFQPFYQVDSSITRRHGGTGLGLVIAKNLVELMDGRIWFESLPGVGTQFYVSLPFEPLPKTEAQELSLPKGLTLVLFERGIEQGEALEERLKRWGVQVKRVREREELGSLLASTDLIDLVLLGLSGGSTEAHKLGQEVWSYPDRERTPIIFTTKLGQELDLTRYQQPCSTCTSPSGSGVSIRRSPNSCAPIPGSPRPNGPRTSRSFTRYGFWSPKTTKSTSRCCSACWAGLGTTPTWPQTAWRCSKPPNTRNTIWC